MKKTVAFILCVIMFCTIFPLSGFAAGSSATYGGVTSNNHVDTSENGKWSSVGGSYLPRANNVVGRWGIACIDAQTLSGNWDRCTSVAAYLYTRESQNRVTEIVSLDVCAAHGETPDTGRNYEFTNSSEPVAGRTYKTVGRTNSSGGQVGPNRIFFHTVP